MANMSMTLRSTSETGTPDHRLRVFLVAEHIGVRQRMRELLEPDPGVTLVGESGCVAAAAELVPKIGVDVLVLERQLSARKNGLCTYFKAIEPGMKIVVLSRFEDEVAASAAIEAGAAAFVVKRPGIDLRAILRAASIAEPEGAARPSA
jgi:DNA-binding NarL/FixJ family response regulator